MYVRATIERGKCQSRWKSKEHGERTWWRQRRQPGVRDPLGQTDVEIQVERRGDFILKELSQTAMLRIDSPNQLALVEAESERVICYSCAGLHAGFCRARTIARRSRSAITLLSTGSSNANSPAW